MSRALCLLPVSCSGNRVIPLFHFVKGGSPDFLQSGPENLCGIAGNLRYPICVSRPEIIPLFQSGEIIRTTYYLHGLN
jgi:hypothetical protein